MQGPIGGAAGTIFLSRSPQVSVVIPVRDGERWLSTALDSVLNQTVSDFELIVIDDGSIDATPRILDDYRRRDSRIRTIDFGPYGLVAALNRGLTAATAPLIARLDADDVCMPHRLERQLGVLAEHPDILLLGSWAQVIDGDGRPIGVLAPPTRHGQIVPTLGVRNPFIQSTVVFRADEVRRLGGYRAAFAAAEDYDLWLRIADIGKVANVPERLIQYRRHPDSVSSRQAVRQSFSARMAQAAWRVRARTGEDPASALSAPPDLFSLEADEAFYAEAACIGRFLALSDLPTLRSADLGRIDLEDFRARIPGLAHNERKLAQYAVINLLGERERPPHLGAAALLMLLLRLHPLRAIKLGLRLGLSRFRSV